MLLLGSDVGDTVKGNHRTLHLLEQINKDSNHLWIELGWTRREKSDYEQKMKKAVLRIRYDLFRIQL